ncbi:MAG: SEC-C domain-containing protein [Myxococcota bacterium]|jgi:hypothetical protein|nr:SEC-C domain-containing protein [Myxococcota bacterium]
MQVQRNDPCPCGSKLKFKNCCMQKTQVEERMKRSTSDVNSLITPSTSPYSFWKRWNASMSRGQFGNLYEMTLEGSPFRNAFESREAFYVSAQRRALPGGSGKEVIKIKVDETQALLLTLPEDDQRKTHTVLESLRLERGVNGWRLAQSERLEVPRMPRAQYGFELFGVESLEQTHRERVATGWQREDLADRPEPDKDAVESEQQAIEPHGQVEAAEQLESTLALNSDELAQVSDAPNE